MTTSTTERRAVYRDYHKLLDMYRAQGHSAPEEAALRQAAESYSAQNKHIPFGKVIEIVRGMIQ